MSSAMPTIDEVLDQEARLVLPSLDENDAVAIGLRLLERATERDLPVTIEVRRISRVVFRAARNGTNAHNDMYVAGKARIVERFGHSTMLERLRHEADGTIVSGLPQQDDHALIVEVLGEYLAANRNA
jgi:uncharacterized protein (UPF0303 family)